MHLHFLLPARHHIKVVAVLWITGFLISLKCLYEVPADEPFVDLDPSMIQIRKIKPILCHL